MGKVADRTQPRPGLTTRRDALRGLGALGLLALGGAVGLPLGGCAAASGASVLAEDPETARLVDSIIGVDMHSHAAGANGSAVPTYDLAARMGQGRMGAVCLCHSSDNPVTRRDSANRVIVARNPNPGELWEYTQRRLRWFDALVREQGLRGVLKPGDLEAAHRERAPAIVQTIEGCLFLEGQVERVATVFGRGVRHLQLVHFLRSDLGDNQTESPTQGGLTPLGREVIAECNRLGIVVDVAHGTMDLVEGAAKASRTPLILSHTTLARGDPHPFSRLISGDHGRLVADSGGVVGIWGNPSGYHNLGQYVDGIARAADTLGVDHVGFGTDNSGFGSVKAVWSDYGDFPVVVQLLRQRGFSAEETGKIAGGNYLRVLNRTLHAA